MKKIILSFALLIVFGVNPLNAHSSAPAEENRECFQFARDVYYGTLIRTADREYSIELSSWAYNDCLTWD